MCTCSNVSTHPAAWHWFWNETIRRLRQNNGVFEAQAHCRGCVGTGTGLARPQRPKAKGD